MHGPCPTSKYLIRTPSFVTTCRYELLSPEVVPSPCVAGVLDNAGPPQV